MKSKPKETTQPKTPEQIMDQLQADLKYWQRELRLQDIDIIVLWMTKDDVENGDILGSCEMRMDINTSILSINRNNMAGDCQTRVPYEQTIIHELLHVVMYFWENDSKCNSLGKNRTIYTLYESSLDRIADALYRGRYGRWRD